ncbi:MAG: hypothetical protein N4A61_08825 [Pelagimonas sp.]|jgi:hypothetical protein|nr:hypothetical protein [Pelagimonas sp.]
MSLIRPEITAALYRWQETVIGVAVSALGFYWAFFTGGGLLHWIGYFLAIFGGILAFLGVQRGRFRGASDGPGLVSVNERRVTYFGPQSGGMVDLDNLAELILDARLARPCWILREIGSDPLEIPLGSRGGEALFDAFAGLPGIRTEHMLREMQSEQRHRVVIWQSEELQNSTRWLH